MLFRMFGFALMLASGGVWLWGIRDADVGAPRRVEFGELWGELHRESLIGLQAGLENGVSPLAFRLLEPALVQPAWIVTLSAGTALFLLGLLMRRRAPKAR